MPANKVQTTIETGDARQQSLEALFAAIDAQDASGFADFLTDDARFRFGSAPAVSGRADIIEAVDAFFASLAGVSHVVTAVATRGDMLFCEGETTYTRHDGKAVVVPFADVFDYAGDRIADYRIYADLTPLYADE
jgi:limonene-1,2-epoxide hydrolase